MGRLGDQTSPIGSIRNYANIDFGVMSVGWAPSPRDSDDVVNRRMNALAKQKRASVMLSPPLRADRDVELTFRPARLRLVAMRNSVSRLQIGRC